jgi:hypothetical protein
MGMAQHVRSLHTSDFAKGQLLGMNAVERSDMEEVRRNPGAFADEIFDLDDPNFTEEQRAGYIVGYFSRIFTTSQQ